MPRHLGELQGSSKSVSYNTSDSRDIASPVLRLVEVVGPVGDERRAVLLIGAPPSRSVCVRAIVVIFGRVEPRVGVAGALRVAEPVVSIVVRVILRAVVVCPCVTMVVVSALNGVMTIAVMAMMAVVLWKAPIDGATVAAQSTMEARVTTIAAMVTTVAATVAIVVPMATIGSISTDGCRCVGARSDESQGECEAAAPHNEDDEVRNFLYYNSREKGRFYSLVRPTKTANINRITVAKSSIFD